MQLVNAVMVVDLWVTSVASGSTSISKQRIAYTETFDKCVHGGGTAGDIRDLWEHFSIAKCSFYQLMRSERQEFVINRQSRYVPKNARIAAYATKFCHGGAIVGIIRELWKHSIAIVQRMPYSQSWTPCLSLLPT